MSQYVTFRLRGQLMGLEILLVREINQLMENTYVHLAPEYIVGLINLRGQIVTIFDLAARLGMPPCEVNEETHNIILKSNDELFAFKGQGESLGLVSGDDVVGLRVDSIGDVVEFDDSQREPVPANAGSMAQKYWSSVTWLNSELLVLLNMETLLNRDPELGVG